MSTHVGSSTICRTTLPNNAALSRMRSVQLSREAKHRLRIIAYYLQCGKVSLTCRHFGIARSYLYKWLKRYNPRNLRSLESLTRRPHRVRQATYDHTFVAIVRKLRTDYPRYSAAKLAVILRRDFDVVFSAATIGRVIQKFRLYFSKTIRVQRARRASIKAWVKRKPYALKATKPHQVIEFDMKHIRFEDVKRYAFVAVDILTKEAVIHVASSPSSLQAKLALEQAVARFGTDMVVVNDNGSENFDKAYAYLQEKEIIQYFARPHTPKDKPHVENLIGKLQQKCFDEHRGVTNVASLQSVINRWLNDYHFFRPHQALHYQTPEEFCATMGLTIPRAEVSTV